MIVTCPSCEARFNLKPETLMPSGRSVRCSKCAHVWRQLPPADMPKRIDGKADALEHRFSRYEENNQATKFNEDESEYNSGEIEVPTLESIENVLTNEDSVEIPDLIAREGSRRSREKRKRISPIAWWGVILVVVAGLFSGAFFGRAVIIDIWPPSSMLYGMVGLKPGAGFGLELRNVAPIQELDGDTAVLTISGEVANISSRVRPVPKLRGALLDASQNEIHTWIFSVETSNLAPKAVEKFSTRVPNPPEGARGLEITFFED